MSYGTGILRLAKAIWWLPIVWIAVGAVLFLVAENNSQQLLFTYAPRATFGWLVAFSSLPSADVRENNGYKYDHVDDRESERQ
jgi:hypothetical protein